jgi:hypothetical protein
MTFQTNPERQIEIKKLAAILADVPVRGIATYADLSNAVGYSVQNRPFALMKARTKAEKDSGMRFETVRDIGIKKLDGESVHGIGTAARKHIGRHARRQSKRLTGLKYNDIGKDRQARIDVERSLLSAVAVVASAKPQKLEEHAQTGPVAAQKVLETLAASGGSSAQT